MGIDINAGRLLATKADFKEALKRGFPDESVYSLFSTDADISYSLNQINALLRNKSALRLTNIQSPIEIIKVSRKNVGKLANMVKAQAKDHLNHIEREQLERHMDLVQLLVFLKGLGQDLYIFN